MRKSLPQAEALRIFRYNAKGCSLAEPIQGIIERVTFHSPESGFSVLRVKVPGQQELVTVVGNATSVSTGEHVEGLGEWAMDRQFGRQFKADQLVVSHPASKVGIEKYLGSGAIRSVGPKIAERIVELFGEQSLDVLDSDPKQFLKVQGIGPSRLERITKSWGEQREVRKITLFLSEYDLSTSRALRIYRTYGGQAISKIKENPYQLARDIRGIGFQTADDLAQRLGIERTSQFRLVAGVEHTLGQLAAEGHCGFPRSEAIAKAAELLGTEVEPTELACDAAIKDRLLVEDDEFGEPRLYLPKLYQAEIAIAESVQRIASAPQRPLPELDIEKAIVWVQEQLGVELAAQQKQAIRCGVEDKVLVITGGPGVGKTTLIRSLVKILAAKKRQCVLAAPTGRAAKRLTETTGQEATTLHRLLEFDPRSADFKRNAHHPLEGDVYIFDEASMIDTTLAFQVLRAIPSQAQVILVGDVDQLPSVGPGVVLRDVIDSGVVTVVRLTEVFRQAAQSKIVAAAYDIHQGQIPSAESSDELSDFYVVQAEQVQDIQQRVTRLVGERIPKRFGLDPKRDIQILTPMNRSELGSRVLNEQMQEVLNPSQGQAEVQRYGWAFRVGDRVMQLENNYDREVYNGDLGTIESINRVEQTVTVAMDGRSVLYEFGELDELSLAYAMSIHKSQGSEFPCVILPLHTQHYLMLQRNLLYTAVTRGKQLVIIVGSQKAIGMAVEREEAGERCSLLRQRLVAAFEEPLPGAENSGGQAQ